MSRRAVAAAAGVALLLAFPWLPGVPLSLVVNGNLAAEYALIAISLVILTGWVGQISLGQGAFVGIGAFTTGLVARELHVPFPLSLPLAAAVTAAVAALLGVVALRIRGLYLAVATLIFAWMADAYLFSSSWLVGSAGASTIPNRPIGRVGTVTRFDLSDPRVFFVAAVAAVAAAVLAAQNLRDSKTGRAFFAIRGSETAAVSLGIPVTRYKLIAFAVSGALAGIAGNLTMTDLRTVTPVEFQFTVSLFFLSIAVVGGITSLGGGVASAVLFAGLYEVFLRVAFLNGWLDIVSVGLLLVVLSAYPGGVGALGPALARALRRRREPADEHTAAGETGAPAPWRAGPPPAVSLASDRADRRPVLEARDVTVRFAGLTAVADVSLAVHEREIVGLIGPNGAGKTTMFNAIAGLNQPAAGALEIFGRDATRLAVHERARMGVGRTFQLIQLFPQLTVFDNLLVATHQHDPTGLAAHVAQTTRAIEAERRSRAVVAGIVEMLGLGDIAHRRVAGLPFGILRRVEIARALVTRSPILMLDEPASGLDNNETDELARLLLFIRASLGVSILLIEHDVRMVLGVSDYIYVLNQGALLTEGAPAEIQRHPEVIHAYLGPASEPAPALARA